MVSPPTPPLCLGGWEHLTSPLFCLYVCICVYVCNVTHVYCVCCMHVLALLFSSSLHVCNVDKKYSALRAIKSC